MRKNIFTKIAAVAAATVLAVTALPALVSDTHAADDEYSYVYAGLTWQEYWANEGVYNAGDVSTSDEKDSHGEYDKGGFDTVSRATTNHGFYRSSFQCLAAINTEEGKKFEFVRWDDANTIVLVDGTKATIDKATKKITYEGKEYTFTDHEMTGTKYVPVKVKTSDLADLKKNHYVVENGEEVAGGSSNEGNIKPYSYIANVTADTNGLKTATKNSDGTFSFSAAKQGTDSGIKGETLKSAADVTPEVCAASGSFGEFLRVDIKGAGYGDLGAKMQAVTWTYYGNDATRTKALVTYGTKFEADNWMHSKLGVQLGITDSARCQLPEGTDGTGYWTLTVRALGYADYTYEFEATDANIVKVKAPVSDTSKLSAAIAAADALNEADYTAESWAAMKLEYEEAVDALAIAEYQADVDEATAHLTAAIEALVKVDAGTGSEGTGDTNGAGTSDAGSADTSVSDVKTGDADNMAVYSLAALLALAAGATVVSRRRVKDVR